MQPIVTELSLVAMLTYRLKMPTTQNFKNDIYSLLGITVAKVKLMEMSTDVLIPALQLHFNYSGSAEKECT